MVYSAVPRRSLILLAALLVMGAFPGATAQPDAGNPFAREPAPETTYRDFHMIADENGPGRMVSNDWVGVGGAPWDPPCGVPIWSTVLRGINGENGSRDWTQDIGNWHKFPGPNCDRYWSPIRLGWPSPHYGITPIDNLQVSDDLNEDGIQDILAYGWKIRQCPQGTCYDGELAARDSTDGSVIWSITIQATRGTQAGAFHISEFPTGLYVYHDPTGPRFVWKTTNLTYVGSTGTWIWQEWIRVADAKNNGATIWQYEFLNVTQYALTKYITGAGQVAGGPEYEIFFDDWAGGTPPNALDVGVLKGETKVPPVVPGLPLEDRILWGPVNCYVPPQRGNDAKQSEETNEAVIFAHVSLIGDVTDDHKPETVCTYLTINVPGGNGDVTSRNGRFKAHVQPVSGSDGKRLWPGVDIKQQGWGFVSDVSEPITYRYEAWGSLPTGEGNEGGNPYIALGTADLPSGTGRGGKFPPMDTRVSLLDVKDGGPVWGTYMEPLAQNDYSLVNWALKQYATTLAGHDYNGDGLRELISAAKYPIYPDNYQVLLSTTHYEINIIDAQGGDIIRTLEPWGPKGMVVACPHDTPDDLTLVAGYGRRLDQYRFQGQVDAVNWREPWYLNPRAQAQTAGIGVVYVQARCGDTPDDRTGIGMNMAIASYKRGFEVLPLYGYVNETGGLHWLNPKLPYRPPLNGSLEPYLHQYVPPPELKETVGMSLLSVTGGVGAAFGSVMLFNARRKAAAAAI